jgi:hypothetical protein
MTIVLLRRLSQSRWNEDGQIRDRCGNPTLPGLTSAQLHPGYHGDTTSLYQVTDAANPTTGRILAWIEKGTWSVSGRAEVPYMLSSEGLTDAEFWQIANGLHPNQI